MTSIWMVDEIWENFYDISNPNLSLRQADHTANNTMCSQYNIVSFFQIQLNLIIT